MKDESWAIFGCIGFLVLFVLFLAFGPLISIWALNTLFPILAIPYTLATWSAVLWLFGGIGGIFQAIANAKKRK